MFGKSTWARFGRKVKRLFKHGAGQTQATPVVAKTISSIEQDSGSSTTLPPMDRAIITHRNNCKRGFKCSCEGLNKDSLEDELQGIEIASEDNRPWIRTKLQQYNQPLKNMVPWLDIINVVAQVNPISGQVSGLVTVALKIAIVIGDQSDDMGASLELIKDILYLLALYEKEGSPPNLEEDIFQAYLNVFEFLCLKVAHQRDCKEAEGRLAKSVKCLESRATPTILVLLNELNTFQKSGEIERRRKECLVELCKTGTPDEESVGIDLAAKDTCAWVFDSSFQPWHEWRDSNESGIMLLTGDIGTGKSTLALQAIEALRDCPSKSCRSVSASFCRDKASDEYREAIICGLLRGIAQDNQEALDILAHSSYRNDRNHANGERNLNAFTNLTSLIERLTTCVKIRKKELCLVVDGIDECNEHSRGDLLNVFTKLVQDAPSTASSPPLKILILSRPMSTIRTSLPSSRKIDLREVRDPQSSETRRIIEGIVSVRLTLDDMLQAELSSLLQEKADGCIQWVTIVVEHLRVVEAITLETIKVELEDLSDGRNPLDDVYLTLFSRHFNDALKEYGNTALRIIAGAIRPLSTDELANAMIVHSLRGEIKSKDDFKKKAQAHRLPRLEPFVRISGQPSRIVMHSSLRELTLRVSHLGFSPSISDVSNAAPKYAPSNLLATTCLHFLLLPYFRKQDVRTDFTLADEYTDELRGFQMDSDGEQDVESVNGENQGPAFFTYAAKYWAHHLSDAKFPKSLNKKLIELSDPGSLQSSNWWKQHKPERAAWEPQQMIPLLAAIYFEHEPVVDAFLQDVPQ